MKQSTQSRNLASTSTAQLPSRADRGARMGLLRRAGKSLLVGGLTLGLAFGGPAPSASAENQTCEGPRSVRIDEGVIDMWMMPTENVGVFYDFCVRTRWRAPLLPDDAPDQAEVIWATARVEKHGMPTIWQVEVDSGEWFGLGTPDAEYRFSVTLWATPAPFLRSTHGMSFAVDADR